MKAKQAAANVKKVRKAKERLKSRLTTSKVNSRSQPKRDGAGVDETVDEAIFTFAKGNRSNSKKK